MGRVKQIVVFVADRFFLLRPLVTVPAVTFFLLGYDKASAKHAVENGRFCLAVLSYAVLMGSVYVLNQIADVESDRVNQKLFLLPGGIIGKNEALVLAVVLALFSMTAAFRVDGTTPWFFGLSLAMGVAYSVPPLALKRRFPLDIISNALGYGVVAYATGWSLVTVPGLSDLTPALPFALCVAAVFALTAVTDREGDRRSGFKSTGVVFDPRQGAGLALFLIVLAFATAMLTHNRVAAVGSVLSAPFFAVAAVKKGSRFVKIAYRSSSAVFVFMVGMIHPAFLVVVLALLVMSRLYYSKRFSLGYPSLGGR